MAQIDRESKTPVYRQIYEDINSSILQGEYSQGRMLPSESRLCSLYGVERATIRRALAMMVDDGKIVKIPGIGASVLDMADTKEMCINKTMLLLLARGRSDTDMIDEPFNAKLLDALDHKCRGHGYALLYKSCSKNDKAEDLIQTCNPCGVFFISILPVELCRMIRRKGIPIVLLNNNHPASPSVCLDNEGGAKMVVEYLLALGHRQIGFIGAASDSKIDVNRFSGFQETLTQNGLTLNADWIVEGNWSMESGKTAMRQLLSRRELPSAVFAANDAMAIGAILQAQDSGISVPGDISIVGFDNIDQSMYCRPSLTTVAVDYDTMSRSAFMLMHDMIKHRGEDLLANIYVPLNLMERESTKRVESV